MFLKEIDYEKGTAQPGIFIWDEKYFESIAAAIALIVISEIAWIFFRLEKLHFHVFKNNKRAIDNYTRLGGEIISEVQGRTLMMEVDMPNRVAYFDKIKNAYQTISGFSDDVTISLDESDSEDGFFNHVKSTHEALDETLKKRITLLQASG